MRKTKIILLIILNIFFHLAFNLFLKQNLFAETSKYSLSIGWIGPLSGNMAVLGVDALNATNLAFDKYNQEIDENSKISINNLRPKIKLYAEDDQYNTIKTIDAYQRLKAKGVKIFIVYNYNGLFAISPKASVDKTILIDPLDCDEDIARLPSNVFCVAKMSEDFGRTVSEFLAKEENSPAAVVYWSGDAFSVKVAKSIKDNFVKLGKTLAMYEGYETSNIDFNPLVLRLKSKGVKSVYFHGNDDAAIFFKKLKELNISITKVALTNVATPDVVSVAGDSLNGVYIGNWIGKPSQILSDFKTSFKNSFKRDPYIDVSTLPSYDVALLIINFLKQSSDFNNQSFSIAPLSSYLLNIKDFKGVSGNITIDADGATRSLKTSIQQIFVIDGKLKSIDYSM